MSREALAKSGHLPVHGGISTPQIDQPDAGADHLARAGTRLPVWILCLERTGDLGVSVDEQMSGRWLCAIGKHVVKFQQDSRSTYVHATLRTSQEADLLMRLRRQGRVSGDKFRTLARQCGLPIQELPYCLRAQADAKLLGFETDASGQAIAVTESIFTEDEVFRYAAARFEQRQPEPAERALMPLMDLLSQLPLEIDQVIDKLSGLGIAEADAHQAVELAEAFRLIQRRHVPEFDKSLLYNEYLWAHKMDGVQKVLAGLGDRDTNDLLGLMEEVRQAQGTPAEALTAAPPHLIKMATRVGLVDGVTIETASGREKTFTFSPQFHGLGTGRADSGLHGISDQVKLLVASIQYGVRYSEDFRLNSPIAFMNRLVNEGKAGDASPIGRDYILVEKFGILRTVPTNGDRYRFEVVKPDIVIAARDALVQGQLSDGTGDGTLVNQSDYTSPEGLRVRLADSAGPTERLEALHLAALRETVQNGSWS